MSSLGRAVPSPGTMLVGLMLLFSQYILAWAHPSLVSDRDVGLTARASSKKQFDFSISQTQLAPDGVSRQMLVVNGQYPGPRIEVNQGDTVVVNVHNKSPYSTTIHFHGIEQAGTPWSDGVPGVTQRPIQPGGSFTYEWVATQYGSYWYHSHYRGQIEDGLLGPIVIHPKACAPKPFSKISGDPAAIKAMTTAEKLVQPLMISDLMHITSVDKWDVTQKAKIEDSCYDALTFNGKGSVSCLDPDEVASHLNPPQKQYLSLVPGSKMTDKSCLPAVVMDAISGSHGNPEVWPHGVFEGCEATKGSTEVIHAPAASNSKERWLAIDIIGAANFVVGNVAIDEHDMWVYAMDGSYIEPQKVQALTLNNGDRFSVMVKASKAGDFKIRCNTISAPQMLNGHAILRVTGQNGNNGSSKSWIDIAGEPVSSDVTLFNQDIAAPFPPEKISETSHEMHVLSMKVDGASYLWALNNTRLMPMDIEERNPPYLMSPDQHEHNDVTLSTMNGTWVDLVFLASVFPMPPHPIHKHGNKMFQIGSGTGHFKWSSVEEAMKEIPEQFNLVNPPRRDTFTTPPAIENESWIVVRYHVKEGGPILCHCHLSNHNQGGMMMVIQDGLDAWPKVPPQYL